MLVESSIAKCADRVGAVVLFDFGLCCEWQRVKVIEESGGAEKVDSTLLVNEKKPRDGEA